MPVGKVFNAAENQVLISPVSSYYQGKAIRQSLAEGEMDISLKKKTLEQADTKLDLEKKRVEQSEEEINLRKEAYAQARQQHEDEVGEKVAKKNAFDVWRITEGVNSTFASGGKTPEAESASLKMAEERLTEYAKSLPDGEGKDKTLKMLEGGVTSDEYRAILDMSNDNAAWYGFKQEGEDFTLSDKAARYDSKGNLIVENTPDFAPDSGNNINFEPVSALEQESATKALDTIPILKDLSDDEKTVLGQMVANDVRQLQANMGKSYAEALKMALAGAKEKVTLESGTLWGKNSKLVVDAPDLAMNEYLINGVIWVEEPDGTRRPKN